MANTQLPRDLLRESILAKLNDAYDEYAHMFDDRYTRYSLTEGFPRLIITEEDKVAQRDYIISLFDDLKSIDSSTVTPIPISNGAKALQQPQRRARRVSAMTYTHINNMCI